MKVGGDFCINLFNFELLNFETALAITIFFSCAQPPPDNDYQWSQMAVSQPMGLHL